MQRPSGHTGRHHADGSLVEDKGSRVESTMGPVRRNSRCPTYCALREVQRRRRLACALHRPRRPGRNVGSAYGSAQLQRKDALTNIGVVCGDWRDK